METEGENIKFRRFLLGDEPENEAAELGVEIIGNPDLAEKLSFAEEALIEDFLDDRLTTREKELFHENFLVTPARDELVREIVLLRSYARNHQPEASKDKPEQKTPDSFFDALKRFLSLNLRPVAAVLVVLVAIGIVWRVFLYDAGGNLTPIEKDYAALNDKDLSSAPEINGLSSKSLAVGTFRDTGAASRLNAANLTENVLFRLALMPETPRETVFDLELIRNGQTIFKQPRLRVYQNPSGQELKVILPKSVLSKGAYQIKLNDGATYDFIVE